MPIAGGKQNKQVTLQGCPCLAFWTHSWNDNTSLLSGGCVILQRIYLPKNAEVRKACSGQGLSPVCPQHDSMTLFTAWKSRVCKMRSKVEINFLFSKAKWKLISYFPRQKKNTHFRGLILSKWDPLQPSQVSSLLHSSAVQHFSESFANCKAQCPFSYTELSQRACSGSVSQVCFGRRALLNPNFQHGSNW